MTSALTFAADTYGLTAARLWATTAALLGLAAVVVGGRALARSKRGGDVRRGAGFALPAGLVSAVAGALNLAVADGGPGTGNGVVGGAMALLLGLAATVLGGLTLTRTRRATTSHHRP